LVHWPSVDIHGNFMEIVHGEGGVKCKRCSQI